MADDNGSPPEGDPEEERLRPPATGFIAILAKAWRAYLGAAGPSIKLFAVLGVIVLVAQTPLMFDLADETVTNLSYLLLVLIPSLVYGYGLGIASYLLEKDAEEDPVHARTAAREVRPHLRTIINAALIGSVLTGVNVLLLGPLLPYLFYGPPILMQTVSIEGLRITDGWARTKALMKGNWGRVILYLISIVLMLGLTVTLALGLLSIATDDLATNVRRIYFLCIQVGVLSLILPFLAAAHFELYVDLDEPGTKSP